jgi:hypothetical protein
LIKKEHVRGTAFVVIEIKRLKRPTDAAISAGAEQRLEDRILAGNEAYGRAQHLRTRETAAEKSALTDLPGSTCVGGIKNGL